MTTATLTPNAHLLELATGYWRTQALRVAAELRIPDLIGDGRLPSARIAHGAGADPDGTERLLRLLAALGVLDRDPEHGYALTPTGRLLRADVPGSMRDLAILYGGEFYAAWGELLASVRDGGSGFARAHGAELFEHLAAHPETSARYDRTMSAGSAFFAAVPDAFAFPPGGTVVDVAGGDGTLLGHVLSRLPDARGVLFDAGHVLAGARARHRDAPYADRLTFTTGDYFDGVPAGGDVYVLSRVVHSYPDDVAARILDACRAAMNPGGTVLLIERVVPDGDGGPVPLGYGLHMRAVMGVGRERTRDGFATLLDRAGLRLDRIAELPLEAGLVVARAGG